MSGADRWLRPWSGTAYRHIPAGIGAQVLDRSYASRATTNRWNAAGQPTLYLAGDQGVLIAEWGRHFTSVLTETLQTVTVEREVYRLDLVLGATLDLRDHAVCDALMIKSAPHCFTDVAVARAVANHIRHLTDAEGIFVPSLAFPDDLDRWCLVLFLEKLPEEMSAFVMSITPAGLLRWE